MQDLQKEVYPYDFYCIPYTKILLSQVFWSCFKEGEEMTQVAFPLKPGNYYVDGVQIVITHDKVLVDTKFVQSHQDVKPDKPKNEFLTTMARALNNMNDSLSGNKRG
jgi:hypothetical protein